MNLNDARIRTDCGHGELIEDPTCIEMQADVECVFRHLASRAINLIREHRYVVGCMAWLTNENILEELAKKEGVSLIVQKEDFLRPDVGGPSKARLRELYSRIPGLNRQALPILREMSTGEASYLEPMAAVRCCGPVTRNRASPRLHHKFIVVGDVARFDDGKRGRFAPQAVWTGSFNFTHTATRSLENAVIIQGRQVARSFLTEYTHAAALSEPLNWEHDYVEPEWRIGT